MKGKRCHHTSVWNRHQQDTEHADWRQYQRPGLHGAPVRAHTTVVTDLHHHPPQKKSFQYKFFSYEQEKSDWEVRFESLEEDQSVWIRSVDWRSREVGDSGERFWFWVICTPDIQLHFSGQTTDRLPFPCFRHEISLFLLSLLYHHHPSNILPFFLFPFSFLFLPVIITPTYLSHSKTIKPPLSFLFERYIK